MVNATHAEAVAALKSVTSSCQLVVSREVLVVLPEEITEEEEGEEEEEEEEGEEIQEKPATPPSSAPALTLDNDSGEEVAKKIVADVLDRSLKRYVST